MSFQETKAVEGLEVFGPFALPHEWARVAVGQCPRCGESLEAFEHVKRSSCYGCGFTISDQLTNQIKTFTRFGEYRGPGISRGYGISLNKFQNETPF